MKKAKLPRDVNQRAKKILDLLTGSVEEMKDERDPAAVSLGSKGGKARAAKLSPAKRKAIAKKAARKRWSGGSDGAPAHGGA
ncbi:MAG: hypothetical protein ABI599_06995 [Flavobacteriales bacterium]